MPIIQCFIAFLLWWTPAWLHRAYRPRGPSPDRGAMSQSGVARDLSHARREQPVERDARDEPADVRRERDASGFHSACPERAGPERAERHEELIAEPHEEEDPR